MTMHSSPDLPIGYWLKKADMLLTEHIDEVQRGCGLNRLDWQILSLVQERPRIQRIELIELLSVFGSDQVIESRLELLNVNNLLIVTDESIYELSERGQDVYQRAHQGQQEVRQRAIENISEEDHLITLQVLQKLVTNLDNKDDE